jgi:diaminopimelate epimerase
MKLKFIKGHGTGNDFVLIPDHDDQLDLTENQVAAICNRSFGIGADGLIRITKKTNHWFMDYRNADGTLAEICGNGTRVMARYLLSKNLVSEASFIIGTRAGDVQVSVAENNLISVILGPVINKNEILAVQIQGAQFQAELWTAPNPHVISIVKDLAQLGNRLEQPVLVPADRLVTGANFEFVQLVSDHKVSMRVFERGVGETLSCGSGAAAVAKYMQAFWNTTAAITVVVPGGELVIESLPEQLVRLTGPAVLVGEGELDLEAVSG